MVCDFCRRHDSLGWLFAACLTQAIFANEREELAVFYLLLPLMWRRVAWQFTALVFIVALPIVILREMCVLRVGRGIDLPSGQPDFLRGSNVLVTGSSSGIGLHAAELFLRHGARVALHGSREKVERVKQWMAQTHEPQRVSAVPFDLEDFDEVRSAAGQLRELFPQIHYMVLNAGLQGAENWKNWTAKSGHDKAMAINQLGHFLLFHLLEDVLAPGARIVVVSSGGAYYGRLEHMVQHQRIRWEDPANFGRFVWAQRQSYADSKLANICFGNKLQRRLAGRASVVVMDPGFVFTGGGSLTTDIPRQVAWSYGPAWKGGRNIFHACFVKPSYPPEWVTSYFLPKELIGSWHRMDPAVKMANHYFQTFWEFKQQWANGLHTTLAPQCPELKQDEFWNWCASAVNATP